MSTRNPEQLYAIKGQTFTAIELPVISEVRGKEYMRFGGDNLFPQTIIDLYDTSAINATCINAIRDGIVGEGIIDYGTEYINSDGETINEVFNKIALDYTLFGGYAMNVIWNKEGTRIAEMHHLPFANVRSAIPNDEDKVTSYFFSSDWTNVRKYKPVEYTAFDATNTKGDNASQIYYCKTYQPGQDVYPLPPYVSAMNDIQLDARIAKLHNANISNGVNPSMFIQFRNGVPQPEERASIYSEIEKSFTGVENSGRFFLSFSRPGEEMEVTPIESANDDYYLLVDARTVSRILSAHRVTSPKLLGIVDASGFSSNADEIITAYSHFMNTVVRPKQTKVIDTFGYLLNLYGLNVRLAVEPIPMIIGTNADDIAVEEDITNIAND